MNQLELKRSRSFWYYMGGLVAIAIATIFFIIEITEDYGGTISDVPAYAMYALLVIGLDLYRRLSFYFRHADDQLTLAKDSLTLCRKGVKKVIKPSDLKKIKIDKGAGFVTLVSYGEVATRIQPWMFGKTAGKFKRILKEFGFN
ncbi:hypothetical protein [Idiomarina aquatica]|nr:hypothetical protein [Idiomarina aquatica]